MDSNAWFRPPSCLQIVACLVGTFIQDCKKSRDPLPFTIVSFFSVSHNLFWIHNLPQYFVWNFHVDGEAMFAGGRFAESREAEIEIPQWSHVAFSAMLVWKLRDESKWWWGVRRIHFHAFSIQVGEAIEAAEWEKSNIFKYDMTRAKSGREWVCG